jgi:hypothetical protein
LVRFSLLIQNLQLLAFEILMENWRYSFAGSWIMTMKLKSKLVINKI